MNDSQSHSIDDLQQEANYQEGCQSGARWARNRLAAGHRLPAGIDRASAKALLANCESVEQMWRTIASVLELEDDLERSLEPWEIFEDELDIDEASIDMEFCVGFLVGTTDTFRGVAIE